jgi:hypothetical protein
LYQRKSLTVQVGIGHPSGGVIERRRIAVEAAEEDKARRPVKILVIRTIFDGILESRGGMSVEFVSSMDGRDCHFYTHLSSVSRSVVEEKERNAGETRQVRFVLSVMSMQMNTLTISTGSSPQHIAN